MAQLIEGPLWFVASGAFLLGVLWRLGAILWMGLAAGVSKDLSRPRGSDASGAIRAQFSRFIPRPEIRPRARLLVIAGYGFHLGLFALLFFAQPHVDFINDRITGFGWAAMPRWAFIVSAEIAFAGLILLWLRRVLNPVTRLLSTLDDHVGIILLFLVMLTGCLALAQSFEALRLIHLALAEILLIYFPFSNLMHAFTFTISRAYTGAMMGHKGIDA